MNWNVISIFHFLVKPNKAEHWYRKHATSSWARLKKKFIFDQISSQITILGPRLISNKNHPPKTKKYQWFWKHPCYCCVEEKKCVLLRHLRLAFFTNWWTSLQPGHCAAQNTFFLSAFLRGSVHSLDAKDNI